MTQRITAKMIEARIGYIADDLGTPKTYFNEKKKCNIGYLGLYRCLGVWALHQTGNENGGVTVLLSSDTARGLFDMLGAYHAGMQRQKHNTVLIDVESELDARGLKCEAPELATEAIENWMRNELTDHIHEMLDAHKVFYSEE